MTLKIINFNLQNKVKIKNYDGGNIPKQLATYINHEKPDIICVQELTDNYQNKLKTLIPNYHFTGENRFNKKSIWHAHFGEKTAIITNQTIINTKTYSLSKNINKIGKRNFLSILPRIATVTTINKNNQNLTIINTHIDHLNNIAKKNQLKYLKKIIKKENKYPIILTGDFNLNTENPIFQNFVSFMETQNCKLVPIKDHTLKQPHSKKKNKLTTPDHIFIPKNYKESEINIQNNNLSDHKLIKLEIKSS